MLTDFETKAFSVSPASVSLDGIWVTIGEVTDIFTFGAKTPLLQPTQYVFSAQCTTEMVWGTMSSKAL